MVALRCRKIIANLRKRKGVMRVWQGRRVLVSKSSGSGPSHRELSTATAASTDTTLGTPGFTAARDRRTGRQSPLGTDGLHVQLSKSLEGNSSARHWNV